MSRLFVLAPLLVMLSGCGFSYGGSQALEINPLNWGTGRPVATPANGPGYVHGEPLDRR